MKTLFLYGPPASGKSTLGAALASRLGVAFADLDAEIARASGTDIPAIFAAEGEPGFRARESAALASLLARADAPGVVALGGGTLLDPRNRALCEAHGAVVCLEAPSDAELARRLALKPGSRPLGNRAAERAAHYASFPGRIAATFDLGHSLVVVGRGYASALVGDLPKVVDANVLRLSPEIAALPEPVCVLPPGEEHKTIATVAAIWSACAKAGLGRADTLVAVGGGVTGDLTGFAAATWMRGIDWINVPTTLLAMVDASTGGKTGCDLPEGKNLAGAFHAPKLVAVDTDFLKTLPPRRLADGRAEMIKHAVISGKRLGGVSMEEIAENLKVKVDIVREDPFERTGRRLLLNCGHTVGHAVEKLTDYAVSHGEAVAIGCVEEARLAVRLGLAPAAWPAELAAAYAAAELPTALPAGLAFEQLKSVMRGDKKRRGDKVTFALPCGWGDVRAIPVELSN